MLKHGLHYVVPIPMPNVAHYVVPILMPNVAASGMGETKHNEGSNKSGESGFLRRYHDVTITGRRYVRYWAEAVVAALWRPASAFLRAQFAARSYSRFRTATGQPATRRSGGHRRKVTIGCGLRR